MAVDGGLPQRSSSLVVNIIVTDSNDNVPQFDRLQRSLLHCVPVYVDTQNCYNDLTKTCQFFSEISHMQTSKQINKNWDIKLEKRTTENNVNVIEIYDTTLKHNISNTVASFM